LDATVVTGVACGLLLFLLITKVPVGISLFVAGGVGVLLLDGADVAESALGRGTYSSAARYILIVIPFFLAMGVFVRHAGLAEALFKIAERLFRRLPGGLAVATIAACAGFAAISGTSVATVASIGHVAVAEMRRAGYSLVIAAGVVGAAGTLGALIPPSALIVLYGIISQESIGQLLIAGIIPGLISAIIYAGAIMLRARRDPASFGGGGVPEVDASSWLSGTVMLRVGLQFGVLVLVVVGGIYSGILTVVEASAAGAAIALVYQVLHRPRAIEFDGLEVAPGATTTGAAHGGSPTTGGVGGSVETSSPRDREPAAAAHRPAKALRDALLETTETNSMIFLLLIGSGIFSSFLVSAGTPRAFANFVAALDVSPALVIVALLLMFIPLGMFLDPVSMLLIAVPLVHPVVLDLGFNGVWFGILVIKMSELALITPPFGMNGFVLAGVVPDLSVEKAFQGLLWYAPLDAATIALLFAFPGLVLWLPNLAGGI
jgi:C4-dicarboxylate transporter DctM subunit